MKASLASFLDMTKFGNCFRSTQAILVWYHIKIYGILGTKLFPNQCLITRECHNTWYISLCGTKMPMYEMTMALFKNMEKGFPLQIAERPKFTPRTEHIALKYYHFRRFVSDGKVTILPIDTLEQSADHFVKPLDGPQFAYLQKKLCGW